MNRFPLGRRAQIIARMVAANPSQEPLVSFDWTTGKTISEAIVTAVADCRGADPTTFAPLYTVIDPDALNTFFRSTSEAATPLTGSIRFRYAGCVVVVKEHGRGYLYDQSDDDTAVGDTERSLLRPATGNE